MTSSMSSSNSILDATLSPLVLDVIVTSVDDLSTTCNDILTSSSMNYVVARVRVKRLALQLPPHDSDVTHCKSVGSEAEHTEFLKFASTRIRDVIGRGKICTVVTSSNTELSCQQCCCGVTNNDLVVVASRAAFNRVWHIDCFVCCVCCQQLVDFVYFFCDGLVYCGRHHAETMKPRCAACDELIFSEVCTVASGKCWHIEHFTCCYCHRPLAGLQYVLTDPSQSDQGQGQRPVCSTCFNSFHVDRCLQCQQPITLGQRHVVDGQCKWRQQDMFPKSKVPASTVSIRQQRSPKQRSPSC